MPKIKPYTQLLNGCYRTEIAVSPTNWNTKAAKIFKGKKPVEWMIWYRFHDPAYRDKYPNGYPVKIRGMNKFKILEQRQAETRTLLEIEHDLIDAKHYNPITKSYMQVPPAQEPVAVKEEVAVPIDDRSLSTKEYLDLVKKLIPEPTTPFISALWMGLSRVKGVPGTINDMGSVIRGTEDAAKMLVAEVDGKRMRLDTVPIQNVRKKHMALILEQCAQINPRWSNNRHNRYKAYLQKIFKPLVTLEAIEMNPVTDIETFPETECIREVLTAGQRIQINKYMKEKDYYFWRFMQIFFHSGARETELMRVQESDVDLVNHRYKVLIKKRRGVHKEVWKTIKDVALPYWQEIMDECKREREERLTNLRVVPVQNKSGRISLRVTADNAGGAIQYKIGYRRPGKDRYTLFIQQPASLPVSIGNLPQGEYGVKVIKCAKGYECLPLTTSIKCDPTSHTGDIYLFSKYLRIGYTAIRPDQAVRRWDEHVKDPRTGLGINVDFYTLKHMNTTEVMDILSDADADIEAAEKEVAELNSHTTPAMVRGVYDVKNQERKRNRVQGVKNTFA